MKMIYDKKLVALLDPADMFIGDVDPLWNSTRQVAEILSQNQPLLQKDVEPEEGCTERFVVSQNRPRYELANEKASHIIADEIVEIVEMATKDLPAIPRDKVDERADSTLHDPVNHPSHYTAYEGLEVIDLTEQMNFNRGNAVKYICRAGLKDLTTEIQDLEKAVWYLNREIARLKGRA